MKSNLARELAGRPRVSHALGQKRPCISRPAGLSKACTASLPLIPCRPQGLLVGHDVETVTWKAMLWMVMATFVFLNSPRG